MEVTSNTNKSRVSDVEPKENGQAGGVRGTDGDRWALAIYIRMFCYKEQRNEMVAGGRYGSRKKFFPNGEKNTRFYAMENDPVKGKKKLEMQEKRGELLEQCSWVGEKE